jgi:outer membrane protein
MRFLPMKFLHCFAVFVLLLELLPPLTCAAANERESLRLNLPAAVALALAEHPSVQIARNRQDSADVSVSAARGSFLPDLAGNVNASERYDQQPPPGDGIDSHSLGLGLSSSFNLYSGYADSAALDGARFQLDAASAELLRQRQTTAQNAASNYITVLSNRELVTVAEENLAREVGLLEQIEAFYHAGIRSVTDFYQQQAAKAQAELDLLNTQRNLEVAQLQLLLSLGQQPPRLVEPQPVDPFALVGQLHGLEMTATLERAMELRPDLLAANYQVEAARETVREARSGYQPRLDLVASANTAYSSLNSGRDFASQLREDQGSAALGLNLSVPIFDRDQTRSNVAQARISESNASIEVTRLRQQIGVEVGQALADYHRAELQLSVSRTRLEAARQALDASEERYRAGAASWVDRTAARATFVSSQAEEVQARYGLLQQGLAVGYARGDLEYLIARLIPGKELQ